MKPLREIIIEVLTTKYKEFGWAIDAPAVSDQPGEILGSEIEALADALVEAIER